MLLKSSFTYGGETGVGVLGGREGGVGEGKGEYP